MIDAPQIAQRVAKVLADFADSNLSLVEQAAVFRTAAETCMQANLLNEIAQAMLRARNQK